MRGAEKRAEIERSLIWWGAMMPNLKRPPTFQEFTGGKTDKRADLRACIAAWDKIDAALRRNKRD